MKKNGFTILEMMVVLLVMAVLLLVTIPNIRHKEEIIRTKGCEALVDIVNSQIMLFEIEENRTPNNVQEMIDLGYLQENQAECPDHRKVVIINGQAKAQ